MSASLYFAPAVAREVAAAGRRKVCLTGRLRELDEATAFRGVFKDPEMR
jgi:hypothetical protein